MHLQWDGLREILFYLRGVFVLNGILALSILLLLVFILAMLSRVNLLSRQIDIIEEILLNAEKHLGEVQKRFQAENGSEPGK